MSRLNNVSVGAGGFVLLGIAALYFLVTQITNHQLSLVADPTYDVTARFDNIGDLKVGAHVAMSGVNIGRVTSIAFDPQQHDAVVRLRLNTEFSRIPKDSSASITTQGVLGGKFISITNGASDVYLKDADQIAATRSAIALETLISQVVVHYLKGQGAPAHGQPAAVPDGR
jgi:phospholipid/cholesterol/gamma-HCH transport system substrate-binding protein